MKKALLFDLPTFPRGVVSLSLPMVAACLRSRLSVRLLDLNLYEASAYRGLLEECRPFHLCGLKVSAQNLHAARAFTALVRQVEPGARVVWGGELPTLLPEACLDSADAVVRGRFEPQAASLMDDLERGMLAQCYEAEPSISLETPVPALDLVEQPEAYLRFMGLPLESSRGCVQHCSFCMVHAMQKDRAYRPLREVARDLALNPREFVNVVDYNLGNDRSHLLSLAAALEDSSASGWMGEICLEALDDEEVLGALARSRCRLVYCGLESVSDASLKTVAKTQNMVKNYSRIIRRAQSHGVEVATGFIIGLGGTTPDSFPAFDDFCVEAGVLYLKLTTLTFNPGTKVQDSMGRLGRYLTDDPGHFDGVRLTYLPEGVSQDVLREGTRRLIESFYSLSSSWKRSRHLAGHPARRAEFMLFSRCYGQAYRDWLEADILDPAGEGLEGILRRPMGKSLDLRFCEKALSGLRRRVFRGGRPTPGGIRPSPTPGQGDPIRSGFEGQSV